MDQLVRFAVGLIEACREALTTDSAPAGAFRLTDLHQHVRLTQRRVHVAACAAAGLAGAAALARLKRAQAREHTPPDVEERSGDDECDRDGLPVEIHKLKTSPLSKPQQLPTLI